MPRWIWALYGSGVSWFAGYAFGIAVSCAYERAVYPPDPDPDPLIRVDVVGVFVAVWVLAWLVFSIGAVWLAYRRVPDTEPGAAPDASRM